MCWKISQLGSKKIFVSLDVFFCPDSLCKWNLVYALQPMLLPMVLLYLHCLPVGSPFFTTPPILQLPLCSILHYTPPTHSAAAPHFSYLISRQQRLTYVLVVLICTSYFIHLIWNVNWCLFASLRGIHFGLHCSKMIPTPALISFISHSYIPFFSKWPFFQSQWSSYTKWSLLQQDCSKTILYSCSFSSFLCPSLSHSSIKLFVFEDSKLVYVKFQRIVSTVCRLF